MSTIATTAEISMVGSSLDPLRLIIARLSCTRLNVLILGETGTGKELVARELWRQSNRSDQAFVPINCADLPEATANSELFGHRRGAFTDAREERIGLFESAAGGVVFLDEVGDLSPTNQGKLLRVLEDHRIRRLGESDERVLDIWIIAATNRDLPSLVREGKFREDLYYRLAGQSLRIPPLSERVGDIPMLVEYYLGRASVGQDLPVARLEAGGMNVLKGYPWPGNIRELIQVLSSLALEFSGTTIPTEAVLRSLGTPEPLTSWMDHRPLRFRIPGALKAADGNVTEAARMLGVSRQHLHRIMKKQGITLRWDNEYSEGVEVLRPDIPM